MKRISPLHAAALIFVLLSCMAQAQIGGQGAISGTVTDATGAVIPSATVRALNTSTNVATTRTTTGSGYYIISPLPVGEYMLTVTAPGFRKLVQEHITVNALQTVGFNATLSVGTTSQSVVVSAAPPPLDTENGTLGTTMEQTEYTNLPLNMGGAPRNPTSFVGLMNGVQGGVGRSGEFNGSSPSGYLDEVYVDGIALTAPVQQGDNRAIAYTVSPEAVEQFQAQTSGSPVEYDGQGIQNYVIKSGTNHYHGNVFGYLRNTAFDTWGFAGKISSINKITGLPVKPVEHNTELGGDLGGPILKNKLFAFGSYDYFRYTSTPNPTQMTLPTAKERTGDFSEFPYPIFDPATTAVCTAANNGIPCRYQFPGNIIPQSRLSPISQKLAAALPSPTNSELTNNYFSAITGGTSYWKSAERVDYNLNAKQRISGILLVGKYATIGPDYTSKLPLPYGTAEYVSQFSVTGDLEHTYVITSHLVNQFKYAFNRLSAPDINATLNTPFTATNAGLGGLPGGEASSTFPAISFSGGIDNPSGWHAITGSVSNDEVVNTYTLLDNLQWIHGRHAFVFGGQFQWLQDNYKYPNNSGSFPMSYTFSSSQTAQFYPAGNKLQGTLNTANTGIAYASFLLGAVGSAQEHTTTLPETGARFKTFSPYIEDDYKILRNLTVNLGLRWDIWTPFKEVNNHAAFLNPTAINPLTGNAGALEYLGDGPNSCHCSTPISLWLKNFGPRVGFAYALNSKTVIRGAYGISYARDAAEGGHNSYSRTGASQQGFSGTSSLSGTSTGDPAFAWDATSDVGNTVNGNGAFPGITPVLPNTSASQLAGYSTAYTDNGTVVKGGTIGYADPVLGQRVPYFQNFNIGAERALTPRTNLSVNYVGGLGHFVPGSATRGNWTNKLNPKYLALQGELSALATPANVQKAQQMFPDISLPYPTFGGPNATIGQMLLPFPQYGGVSDMVANVGNITYNSLQLTLNQKTWQGVTFTLNYTYGIAKGDVSDSRSSYAIPPGVVAGLTKTAPAHSLDHSWQSNANKQAFTIYGVWALPFGKGRMFSGGNWLTRPIVNDWQFSSTYQYHSGGPVAITASKCVLVGQGTCYPNYVPGFSGSLRQNGSLGSGYVAGGKSPQYLKTGAFVDPAPYMIGNVHGRAPYNLWSPGSYTLNSSLRKSFPIHESTRFTFEADCFNVPNKVTFGYASTNIDASNFGQTKSGSGNRDWQFAGRIDF